MYDALGGGSGGVNRHQRGSVKNPTYDNVAARAGQRGTLKNGM
jgi:hypothetical protein